MLVQPPPGPLTGPVRLRNRRKNPFWRFRRLLFVMAVIVMVTFGGVWAFASQVELDEDNFEELIETSYICTAEVRANCGEANAANELSAQNEQRVIVDYEEIPEVLIQAVIATEDRSYFDHRGVDPRGLLRAVYQTGRQRLTGGSGSLQGGSTITQQYIKLATEDDADEITRKAREIVRAIKFEQELTDELGSAQLAKEEILERYLNRVYLGRSAHGVEAASQAYFGKPVTNLNLAEAAFIAGLLRAPERADPSECDCDETGFSREANRRREVTLQAMFDEGYITAEDYAAATADLWPTLLPPPELQEGLGDVEGSQYGSEFFIAAVRAQLTQIFPDDQLYTESLRIYTTLDPEVQRLAYQTVTAKLDPNNPFMPKGSLTAVNDQGEVVAMMAGADWETSQVNLAMGPQGGGTGFEAGSQMKIFALAEYIEQGFSPESYYPAPRTLDYPQSADGQCGRWQLGGGGRGDGTTEANHRTVYDSTQWSRNVVYAQMAHDIGADRMIDMARRLGMQGEMLECPSTVLGGNATSTMEMASAYANLLREGQRLDPVLIERIEDADGNVLCWYPVDSCDPNAPQIRQGEQVVDASVARVVVGAMERVVANGTGTAAQLTVEEVTRPSGGKTGTTQRNQHAWYTGFTCGLTTSVWVGYPGQADEPTRLMNDSENEEIYQELVAEIVAEASAGLPEDAEIDLETLDLPERWPTMEEIFGTDAYNNRSGNGDIGGGDIPAELWHDFMIALVDQLPPCETLPTEGPGDRRIAGQELLTTLLHCAEPDPLLFPPTTDTTTTESTTTDSTDSTETTTESTTTSETAPPDTQPPDTTDPGDDDEDALGPLVGSGAGAGSGLTSGGLAIQAPGIVFNPEDPPDQEAPDTTLPPTAPPTTDPCIPIDPDGNPLETTIPSATAPPATPPPDDGDG